MCVRVACTLCPKLCCLRSWVKEGLPLDGSVLVQEVQREAENVVGKLDRPRRMHLSVLLHSLMLPGNHILIPQLQLSQGCPHLHQ